MHASQIQGCVVEQRVEKKRKIAESVWVHNVVTVRTGKVAAWPVCNALYAKVTSLKCTRHILYISYKPTIELNCIELSVYNAGQVLPRTPNLAMLYIAWCCHLANTKGLISESLPVC